ncbi:hypothetical protein ACFLQJ_00540 [Calditrichota bacterium]
MVKHRSYVVPVLFTLILSSCSHHLMLRQSSNSFFIVNDSSSKKISDSDQLYLEWMDSTGIHCTEALTYDCSSDSCRYVEKPVTVSMVEINEEYIRLGSHVWNDRECFPKSYNNYSNEIRISGIKNPTIIIPVKNISKIYYYKRKVTRKDLLETPKYIGLFAGV